MHYIFLGRHVNTSIHCKQSFLLSSLPRRKRGSAQSRQAFEAAAAQTSGVVNLFFSFSNYFPSTSIRLMVNRVCYRRARCSKHTAIRPGFKYISSLRACSTKILLDSSTVFLEYNKIEQAKEGFCWQGDRLMNRIKLILSKLKKSSEKIIYLN